MKFLVTGGAGFIGSAVVRLLVSKGHQVLNVDKLTYAGNKLNVGKASESSNYKFLQADICDKEAIRKAFAEFKPNFVMHLAAESHVDRSIDGPGDFIQTNIIGTFNMLGAALEFFKTLSESEQKSFRFHHISTDEVYGELGDEGKFLETTPYDPSSPYSASKAASDHLVRAWGRTYKLPVVITNCSNNYGPYHFPEKLIPLMILNGLEKKPLPVYGNGSNIRDWLYVEDHAYALYLVVTKGRVGETYNIGGESERTNLEVVKAICSTLDELNPKGAPHSKLITYVKDRPGHDFRYAIDCTKIKNELGWEPTVTFEEGLTKTIQWYLRNGDWCMAVSDKYKRERLGSGS